MEITWSDDEEIADDRVITRVGTKVYGPDNHHVAEMLFIGVIHPVLPAPKYQSSVLEKLAGLT